MYAHSVTMVHTSVTGVCPYRWNGAHQCNRGVSISLIWCTPVSQGCVHIIDMVHTSVTGVCTYHWYGPHQCHSGVSISLIWSTPVSQWCVHIVDMVHTCVPGVCPYHWYISRSTSFADCQDRSWGVDGDGPLSPLFEELYPQHAGRSVLTCTLFTTLEMTGFTSYIYL